MVEQQMSLQKGLSSHRKPLIQSTPSDEHRNIVVVQSDDEATSTRSKGVAKDQDLDACEPALSQIEYRERQGDGSNISKC